MSGSLGSEITEAEQAYYESLQKFGEANRDNAATFHQLSQANSSMASNIASDVKTLQHQMAQLLLAVNHQTATPAAPLYPPHINAAYGISPHPAYTTPPPPPPTQQYQAYQHYQQPYHGYGQQSGGRGGRVGGSGHGRGRGRGRGKQNPYMQQQPQGYGQQFNAGRGQSQGYYHQTPMNPVKYYKNWNYCWSCGFDVPDWHTSATCPNPHEGHITSATRDNPCNGCMKAKHKTQM